MKKEKGSFADKTLKELQSIAIGSCPREEGDKEEVHRIPAAAVAGDEVRGARGLEGEEANLLVGLGASRGGRKRLVGIGTEHSGEGTHRQRGFSRGMAGERGRWATLEQGEAAGMVGRGGATLERWVHSGAELAGEESGVAMVYAGEKARPVYL